MTLTIPEDILRAAQLDEHSMLVEIACHLFAVRKLTLGQAIRFAKMTRTAFEDELRQRHIPLYRYDVEDFQQDMETLSHFRKQEP